MSFCKEEKANPSLFLSQENKQIPRGWKLTVYASTDF